LTWLSKLEVHHSNTTVTADVEVYWLAEETDSFCYDTFFDGKASEFSLKDSTLHIQIMQIWHGS